MQLTVKTILNKVHPLKNFIYSDIWLAQSAKFLVEVSIAPRKGSKPICSRCHLEAPGYDTLPQRRFSFIPLWLISVVFLYAMRRAGRKPLLVNLRWTLLKRWKNLRGGLRVSLRQLLSHNLRTIRAYILKEDFANFWHYRSKTWAKYFLDLWTRQALQSRIQPMRKVARMLRAHEPLLWNWFEVRGQLGNAVVEGFNNKLRVITRRSYGFRTYRVMELVLYHTLGELPEPVQTHKFC
ncbi:MAG: transposase [Verrucomicrobiae bacterium]|nr:transposase [Verrucomicrobiae bacterium]